jgi:hypothetical protein
MSYNFFSSTLKKKLARKILVLLGILILVGIGVWFSPFRVLLPFVEPQYSYAQYKTECRLIQAELRKASLVQRRQIFRKAISTRLFKYWEGTLWGFNGTTEVPRKGRIACGYFVTTLLRDCGIPVQRSTLAQQASEKIVKTLVKEAHIQRFSRVPLKTMLKRVRQAGDQVYIIGLDTHVGFLVADQGHIWFIHSSGRNPWSVVREDANTSVVLEKSVYKVLGCLTADPDFIGLWNK